MPYFQVAAKDLPRNMLTAYPALFGALICGVPLLDMANFHRWLAGASWIAEFGNPDIPQE